jgi:hypothetical protein
VKEICGDLWSYWQNQHHVICLTTNGFIKKDGRAVMGRGCANEARFRIPGVTLDLADYIRNNGNVAGYLYTSESKYGPLIVFPVKHAWYEKADPELIKSSVAILGLLAQNKPDRVYILPRPGCGNGQLSWTDVKPLLVQLPDNVRVICFPQEVNQ